MFNFSQTSDKCIKCAKCIPTCTIHAANPDETTSPRGFLHLLGAYHRGEIELDKTAKDIFESCFLCTNCTYVCPSKLPTDLLIEQVRADIAKKYGIAWFKRAFFLLLRHRALMDLAAKLGFIFRSCGFRADSRQNGMRAVFSLPFIKKNRLLPSIARTSFMNSYPEFIDFGGSKQVAIFVGCMVNYAYSEVGDALLYILKRLGINALIPRSQLCCGAPAYFTGDLDTVRTLIKKNIAYFEEFIDDFEAVLIPEATCSSMIIHDWLRVLDGEPLWQERAQKIIQKCHITTKWLEQNTDLAAILATRGKSGVSVTYHDPCHARKTQNVYREPRALLGANYELREMSDPNACCGFGGVTMQSQKYELSLKVGLSKAKMISNTGAKFVSAECSACRVQLSNALHQESAQTVFIHPLELMAKILKETDA
ncbi:MAG: (Fe-S)-binding protein [Helicobacteraceae bacterium]